MDRTLRIAAIACLLVGTATACDERQTDVIALSSEGDTVTFTVEPDTIIERADTTITPTDTTVIVRVDTVIEQGDPVIVTRVDTVVSGVDTTFTIVEDTVIVVDTLVITTTDSVIVFDTLVVTDTVVVAPPTLNFERQSLTLNTGDSATFRLTLLNHLGQPLPIDSVTWVSENRSVVRMSPRPGTAVGVGAGNARVFAFTGAGISGSIPVTVVDPTSGSGSGGSAAFRRNLPAGWTPVTDYGFGDDITIHHDGTATVQALGSSGWTVVDWGQPGGGEFRASDPSAPFSPPYVIEEIYPPHLSGNGPGKWTRDMGGSFSKVYVSWIVKWDQGFDHNRTSEKMIFFNYGGGGSNWFLFQFQWGVEMMNGLREPSGAYDALRANQLPPNANGHGNAPPVNGVWIEYELLFDQTTGTVKWWKDGVLHGSHTGVTFNPITDIEVAATWGGGGDKQGTHSRYTDHFFVAVGS